MLVSCNESLPVYSAPGDVLKGVVIPLNTPADTVNYQMLDFNNPNLIEVKLSSPPYQYDIKLVNTYEETIQDEADIQGTLELTWIEKPDYRAVIPVSATALYSAEYDQATNMLTVNPGDTVTFRVYWNFRLENSDWVFTKQQAHDGNAINGKGDFYRYHFPMLFRATAKIRIFRSLSFVETVTMEDITLNVKGRIVAPP